MGEADQKIMSIGVILVIIGASIAAIGGGLGSTIAVWRGGVVGSSIISEKPEIFGNILLLQALPGTQGIYGFLGAVMALQKVGLLGGELGNITPSIGWQIIVACLPIAVIGLITALLQAKVSVSGMDVAVKQPQEAGKAIILSAMVETYAVIALLTTILMINGIKMG